MSDDRYIVHIDRDEDGVADETIDPELPSGGSTEQPPHIQLPPRPMHPTTFGGGIGSRADHWDAGTDTTTRRAGTAMIWVFAAAAVAVVLVAALVAIGALRLVAHMVVSDFVSTLAGLVVGITCSIGGFLAIARLTRLLRLDGSSATGDAS